MPLDGWLWTECPGDGCACTILLLVLRRGDLYNSERSEFGPPKTPYYGGRDHGNIAIENPASHRGLFGGDLCAGARGLNGYQCQGGGARGRVARDDARNGQAP